MTRYRLRMIEFESEDQYPQGEGATWEPVEIEVEEEERIFHVTAGLTRRRCTFNFMRPTVTVWVIREVID